MVYAFTFWTCYTLRKEYETVASMRLHFLASEGRRPDQFTVRSNLSKLEWDVKVFKLHIEITG